LKSGEERREKVCREGHRRGISRMRRRVYKEEGQARVGKKGQARKSEGERGG